MTQALSSHQAGQYGKAEQFYQSVLQFAPEYFDALHLMGVLEDERGNGVLAVQYIRKALAINPRVPHAHVNLGSALRRLGRLDEALDSYDAAIAVQPDLALAHFNRGNVLRDMTRLEEAFDSFCEAARLDPDDADARNNCGSMLWKARKYEEALPYFDGALAINPFHFDALINKGSTLEKLERDDEALELYERVLSRQPDHVVAIVNRGSALEGKGFTEEALQHYLLAQRHAPDDVSANLNEGFCRLKQGDFEVGLEKYEWRWKGPQERGNRQFEIPRWNGEDLAGKRILLHAEQGFGDTLQFCRYASLLAQRRANVVLEVPPSLVRLLEKLDGVERVLAHGAALPDADFHCPLLSVPLLVKTRVASIPAETPYLYVPDDSYEKWARKIGISARRRIGIAWGTTTKDTKKVLPISVLSELFDCNCDFFVVQKDIRESDRVVLESYPNVRIVSDELSDFCDTAALLSLMDRVVTIDTSIAHLAGALGLRAWIMLHVAADWRWFEGREDSPWYPTVRLVRQSSAADWNSVVQRVKLALNDLIERVE
ncbi:tetratricopeptide repeat protein [Uliginosibacterium sp. H3]|uniref:Tetratricopeptide repeat protein n=1 Tax=Uliginosibacterium silvisoli TaxID=3114758 RepID=A0ABU6K4G4_9RHOO|nr:tetratricopeptide repeat protein [Uliginosibacterium sp. H3]